MLTFLTFLFSKMFDSEPSGVAEILTFHGYEKVNGIWVKA